MSVPMKDSGVDWIGEVPSHWDVVPPSTLFAESKERARDDDQILSATQKYGVIPMAEFEALEQRQVTKASTNFDMRKHVEIGDFVISMRSMDGGLERAHAVGSVRSSYSVLKASPDVDGRFYGALVKSSLYIQALRLTSNFIRDGQDLNFSHVRQVKLPRPGLEEQAAIADYIEVVSTRIDALVAKKTRFIDLLREKRQALITHAVTKGLNADVPMKNSGVEWLGEVPATWDTAPLRVFLKLRRDIVGADSATVRLLSLTIKGVIERDLDNPTGKMPASFDGYQRISTGEMVFCLFDMDETPRTVGVAQQDGMLTGAYTVFQPQSDLWARYLNYFFLHIDEYKRLRPFYRGLRKTIRPGPFLSIQVPRPREDVAAEIVERLDRATARIDTLIGKTERSIELLREHRSALITAAVTGKIDLRNAV
jgi:type I restriction enzyme, S subunit